MQPLEILPSAPDPSLSQGSDWSNPLNDRSAPGPFDAFIGRALSRSSDTAPDDNESSDEPAPGRSGVEKTRKNSTTDAAQPDSCACAGNSITPAEVQKTVASVDSRAKCDSPSNVEGVSNSGRASGPGVHAPSTTAAGPGSLAGQLRSLLPTSDAKVQASPAESPADPTLAGNDTGSTAGSNGSGPAVEGKIPGADVVGDLTPDAKSKAITENPVAVPAGKAGDNGSPVAIQAMPAGVSGTAGISSAQHQLAMQKAEKTNEISAPTEQNLPASLARDAGEKLPTRSNSGADSLSRSEKTEFPATTGSAVSGVTAATESISRPAEPVHWPSSAPARSLERTQDLMSLHAFRLRDSGTDSLQVVIKPGTGLQLSLNLQMRGSNVEMRATLHRGDFDFLNRHWSELQQQLESRGVRLAPLTRNTELADGNDRQFQNPDRSPNGNDATPAGSLAEFALADTLKTVITPKSRTVRGWESWA
jgi:hypothetical protein